MFGVCVCEIRFGACLRSRSDSCRVGTAHHRLRAWTGPVPQPSRRGTARVDAHEIPARGQENRPQPPVGRGHGGPCPLYMDVFLYAISALGSVPSSVIGPSSEVNGSATVARL